jgi:hypothetical protein
LRSSPFGVGLQVVTAVVTRSSIFLDITLCSLLEIYRYFGRTCRLHLQHRRISPARNQHEEVKKLV